MCASVPKPPMVTNDFDLERHPAKRFPIIVNIYQYLAEAMLNPLKKL